MLWIVSTSHAQWIRILGQSPLAGEDMSPEVPTQINQSFALQDPSALPLDLRDRPRAGSTHATSNVSPASDVQSKESVLGGRRAFLRLRFSECPLLLPAARHLRHDSLHDTEDAPSHSQPQTMRLREVTSKKNASRRAAGGASFINLNFD